MVPGTAAMSISERLREIFPTKGHSIFFLVYVLLYIFNAIFIRLSQRVSGSGYDYDTSSVILVTELVKLFFACSIYVWGHSVGELCQQLVANRHQALFYMIPAILYCIYNNLTYVSLSYFDPTTYYILLQFRIAVTGVIYQIIFQRLLSRAQWISLLLLTLGCIIKQMGAFDLSKMKSGQVGVGSFFNGALLLIAVQILCSCLAGVYNEYLLKKQQSQPILLDKEEIKSTEVHLMIQNCFMYIDSILCNLLVVTYGHSDVAADKPLFNFDMFSNILVLTIICVSAFCGLSTSYFIKMFNSIMKAYTTGIELLLTAILCLWLFGTPLDSFTLISIVVISYASYLFAKNPVINRQAPV